MDPSVAERVRRAIETVTGADPARVTDDALLVGDLGADSLDAVDLAITLEEEFGIGEIPERDFLGDDACTKRVKDVVAYIEQRVGAAKAEEQSMDRYFPILRCPRGNEMIVTTKALMFAAKEEADRIANGHFAHIPTWSWVLAGEWRPTGEVLTAVGGSAGRPVVYADYPCDTLSGAKVSVALLSGPDFEAASVATSTAEAA